LFRREDKREGEKGQFGGSDKKGKYNKSVGGVGKKDLKIKTNKENGQQRKGQEDPRG